MSTLQGFFDRILESAERDREKRAKAAGLSVEELRAREKAEHAEHERRAKVERAARDKEIALLFEKRDVERGRLGERLGLDAPCHIGHIIKLSGLSSRSAGDGWDRATVNHVVIDGEVNIGRLSRSAGDLLCRKSSSLGGRSMGVTGRGDWDGHTDPNPETTRVTCKSCLERLATLKSRANKKAKTQ
jgi:hypothetical protein